MDRKYLIRLDDACPTMDAQKWTQMERLLDKYNIKPMVGVIPNNTDPDQIISESNPRFWELVKEWQSKGWAIALHGFCHQYHTRQAGINPMWNRSEYAGVDLDRQRKKISEGMKILNEKGITPKYFFAPSHTYDSNTIEALRLESDIRIISDNIALYPYKKNDFCFVPQIGGRNKPMPVSGIFTYCYHPSTMMENDFAATENFFQTFKDSIITFDDIDYTNLKNLSIIDRVIRWLYFKQREIRGIKNRETTEVVDL